MEKIGQNSQSKRFFRGWALPGPEVPGEGASGLLEKGETLDALSGHFRIFQLQAGHRFSTDDLLVAWYGTLGCPSAGRILDLGGGIGSVGMTAAWRLPGTKVVAIEAQADSVRLARKSLRYNGLSERYEIREGDFRDPALLRENESFDLVLGSPPYFPLEAGIPGDHPQKVACRFETRGDVSDYCRIAARQLAPGGFFACVFPINPPHQEKRMLEAAHAAGLSIVRSRAVVLKAGEPPLLSVFGMSRAEDLPETFRSETLVEPPLVIRDREGNVTREYSVVKLSIGFPP